MRLLTTCLLALPLAAAEPFSLADILGSAFPTELTAAPTGSQVAFVLNSRGVRNIYVASAGAPARVLTSYASDDGQDITELRWSADARYLVYVRGGAANRSSEIPNPTSDPMGAEQSIWAIAASGGSPSKLGDGASPVVSPSGDRVVFVNKGQIWSAPLDASAKAAQLIKARGTAGGLTISPDGKMLAFSSNRGDHAFIGVYNFADKSLRYLDPSLDHDSAPLWAPDSGRIAFVRRPASKEIRVFGPRREAEPWSLHIAAASSGAARRIWKADPGSGSVFASHALPAASQLFWAIGDRIVFSWERDGWNHLYAVPATGGPASQLTSGAFEVESATLAPDRKSLIVTSNRDDIDRRHIWRVLVNGSRSERLTTGNGIEWSGVLTGDGKSLAWLASDSRKPAHVMMRTGEGTAAATHLVPESIPPSFPTASLVEPRAVLIDATDGMKIPAQLFLPANLRAGEKRSAAIFFHGGSRRQMLLGWHYSSYYHNCYALSQYLASRGFIALAVNYRSGIGYGMEFREALDYGASGASEFRDVLGAGLFLRNHPSVDGKRIAVWGGSYGGFLTAMALSRASDLFAAGVDIHGVHDWNVVTRNFVPSYDPQANQATARLAFESSPMSTVKGWRSPVLLIHGDDDRNVPFSESVTLVEELRKNKVDVEQLVFPDEVHGFLRYANWLRAWKAAAQFLESRLAANGDVRSRR